MKVKHTYMCNLTSQAQHAGAIWESTQKTISQRAKARLHRYVLTLLAPRISLPFSSSFSSLQFAQSRKQPFWFTSQRTMFQLLFFFCWVLSLKTRTKCLFMFLFYKKNLGLVWSCLIEGSLQHLFYLAQQPLQLLQFCHLQLNEFFCFAFFFFLRTTWPRGPSSWAVWTSKGQIYVVLHFNIWSLSFGVYLLNK